MASTYHILILRFAMNLSRQQAGQCNPPAFYWNVMDTNKIIRRKRKGIHEEAKGRTFNLLVTISTAFNTSNMGKGVIRLQVLQLVNGKGRQTRFYILYKFVVCSGFLWVFGTTFSSKRRLTNFFSLYFLTRASLQSWCNTTLGYRVLWRFLGESFIKW
jgi:hypothetical protein